MRLPSGHGERDVLENARTAVRTLRASAPGPIESIGVGIPGNVEADRGVVWHAVNLGVTELHLGAGLAELSEGPVRVDNDVNAAALGAFSVMAEMPNSMAYLNVGTGLAAGLVLDGRVWRGYRGISGEVGHFPLYPGGDLCPCGQRGCIETVASGAAIASQWRSARPFAEAIVAGDADARDLLTRVSTGIADAVQLLVLTAGVERVVLGGGVIANIPELVATVVAALEDRTHGSGFLASVGLADRIAVAPPESEIAVIGAALLGASATDVLVESHRMKG